MATNITNNSGQAFALPDGTYLPAGETVTVTDEVWAANEENETVQAWIEAGAISTESAPSDENQPDEEEERRNKLSIKKEEEEGNGRPSPSPRRGRVRHPETSEE
jgi:hypothetical protein